MERKVLPHELTGNKKSNVLIVFLHGWPDSVRLWDGTNKKYKSYN